ncbi:DUF4430 domain-containing protein [Candidatus Falkowbacteria bacterium]|nr:DUF4430 domain-containing protein [Candidatus Falkowbacteria bacterium]
MKTKYLTIIFILFLLIALFSGLVVFLTEGKGEPVLSERTSVIEKPAEPVAVEAEAAKTAAGAEEKAIRPENITTPLAARVKIIEQPQIISFPAEEKINAAIIINGVKYETEVKPDSSVYDLMILLKTENKINFSGKNYSGLGFFIEEINGAKNDSAGKNWLYYINGQPAQIGASNYLIKNNDIIEWKYEKKSF